MIQKVSLSNYNSKFCTKLNSKASGMGRVSFSGLPKCEVPSAMDYIAGQIRNVTLKIVMGEMTKIKADAYIIPQFDNCVSYGGVGGAVARSGALKGIEEFADFISKKGEQKFGTVLLTKSYGGNSDKLLHTVSVDPSSETEFTTVQTSIYNALRKAEQNGIKSVVSPALGTGTIGKLTPEQSAKAILSSVKHFADEGRNMDFAIAIYGDRGAYCDFENVICSKSYENVANEIGQKSLDADKWAIDMFKDIDDNKKSGIY